MSGQEQRFRMLAPERIGCELTENWQIDLEAVHQRHHLPPPGRQVLQRLGLGHGQGGPHTIVS
jgi:hypothetical protein